MSVKIMGLVWDLDLESNKKFVLLAYADHASHDGTSIYPSIELIAKKTGYHERSVQRITKELSEAGYLIQNGQGPRGTNKWKIPLNMGGDKIAPLTSGTETGDIPSGDIPSGDILTPDTQSRQEPSEEEGEVFKVYEQNIEPLTPVVADALGEYIDEHGAHWTQEAIKEAAKLGKRNSKYIGGILRRWRADGYGTAYPKNGSKAPAGRSVGQSWLEKRGINGN